MPPRILLANEFGAGRGHLVTLTRLAQAFGPGFAFDGALGRMEHANELAPLGAEVFPGPLLVYDSARRTGENAVQSATWGEFLGDLGFDDVARLREIVAWWRHVLASRHVAAVLADYAPLALMAARSLGIPTVATGTGYGLPPPEMGAFPFLNPGVTRRLHDEARLLANVNQVAREIGLPPLTGLPEVYRADLPLIRTLPMLDPYAAYRRDPVYLPPVTDISPVLAGGGDEVFIYFSTIEFDRPGVVEALEALPMPRRAYLPAPPPGVAERLAASGVVLETRPVPVAEIARRSRLLVNAGQHGILSLGLYAGLPQVCLTQHLEQLFHARKAETAGVAVALTPTPSGVAALAPSITAAYGDVGMAARAQGLAQRLRADLAEAPEETLKRAVAPLRRRLLAGA